MDRIDSETERLTLERITPDVAQRIVDRVELATDRWHAEYPLADELDPLRALAESTAQDPVFTLYLLRRKLDGLAIGGLGFFGPPDADGRVEFGYGLVASARGAGMATEAVRRALEVAAEHGARVAGADTDPDNVASQRVLLKAGLTEDTRDAKAVRFSRVL